MGKPPPLEGAQIEAFTRAMFTELVTALARSLNDLNLSLIDISALHLIDRYGPLKIGDLADRLAISMPVASRTAAALVDLGLVERRENESDRRAKVLTLSPEGVELIDRTSRERVAAAREAASRIGGPMAAAISSAVGIDLSEDIKK